jgi:hypothetical protein
MNMMLVSMSCLSPNRLGKSNESLMLHVYTLCQLKKRSEHDAKSEVTWWNEKKNTHPSPIRTRTQRTVDINTKL